MLDPRIVALVEASRLHCPPRDGGAPRDVDDSGEPRAWTAPTNAAVAEARMVLRDALPSPRRSDDVTGLLVDGPWRQWEAIELLARDAEPQGHADVVAAAAQREGIALTWRCAWALPRVLGPAAEAPLAEALEQPLTRSNEWVWHALVNALEALEALALRTVCGVVDAGVACVASGARHLDTDDLGRWVRRRFALQPLLAQELAGATGLVAGEVRARADLAFDARSLDDAWREACPRLPGWRWERTELQLPWVADGAIPFLVADGARCFVPAMRLQCFQPRDRLEIAEFQTFRAWRAPSDDGGSAWIVEPGETGWRDVLALFTSGSAAAATTTRFEPTERSIQLPGVDRVDSNVGLVASSLTASRRPVSYRIGGVGWHDVDRPFLLARFDGRSPSATCLGVAKVDARTLLRDYPAER